MRATSSWAFAVIWKDQTKTVLEKGLEAYALCTDNPMLYTDNFMPTPQPGHGSYPLDGNFRQVVRNGHTFPMSKPATARFLCTFAGWTPALNWCKIRWMQAAGGSLWKSTLNCHCPSILQIEAPGSLYRRGVVLKSCSCSHYAQPEQGNTALGLQPSRLHLLAQVRKIPCGCLFIRDRENLQNPQTT